MKNKKTVNVAIFSIYKIYIFILITVFLCGCAADENSQELVESEQSAETVQDEQTSQTEETKQEEQGKITYDDLNTQAFHDQLYKEPLEQELFSLNLETGESGILYDTENNGTRIIGYRDGTIYLFDSTYTVYEQRLDSGEQQELGTVPKADEIVFDWQDDYLIIRSQNHAGSDTNVVNFLST